MASPALRAPIEYTTNKQAFNGLDIEKFAGEKSTNIPGLTKRQRISIKSINWFRCTIKTSRVNC